jgi:dihydrofolate reductase
VEVDMKNVIVIEFVSADGVTQDPDGAEGTDFGGWCFRYGPELVSSNPFRLDDELDTGALLLGRKTWEHFTQIWPSRSDEFSTKLNAMPKLVASRSLDQVDAWSNSTLVRGDLADEVTKRKEAQDVIVMGSASVVRTLMDHDLVDEYRLVVFPTVLGQGTRLFGDTEPIDLDLASAEQFGPTLRLVYRRAVSTTEES